MGDDSKPKTAKERLEAWKRQRELERLKDGEANSATPEPTDKKASIPIPTTTGKGEHQCLNSISHVDVCVAALPAKPTGFSLGGLSRIGLPVKPGSVTAPPKRTIAALDDETAPDRKLQKLDLPEVNPEVQSGEAVGEIGDDLAVVDGDEAMETQEVKPKIEVNGKFDAMDVDQKPTGGDDDDELEAFMRENNAEVKRVNTTDANRHGLLEMENSDDEAEFKNKAEEELAKAEALLQQAASKSRKKDLPTPDHSLIDYEPFQKAFYSAPVEVLEMDEEETELVRLEMDGIKIRGQDAPRPVRNWGAFGLPTYW